MPPQSGSGRGAGPGRTQRGPSLGRGGGSASPQASPFGSAPTTHASKAASQSSVTAPPSPFASASTGTSQAAPPTPTPAHDQTLHAPGAAGTSGPPLEDLGALDDARLEQIHADRRATTSSTPAAAGGSLTEEELKRRNQGMHDGLGSRWHFVPHRECRRAQCREHSRRARLSLTSPCVKPGSKGTVIQASSS